MQKIISGKENVQDFIESELNIEKKKLMEEIKDSGDKFLFMVLWIINSIFGPTSFQRVSDTHSHLNSTFYKVMLSLKAILDTLLEKGINRIKAPTDDEFEAMFQYTLGTSTKYTRIFALHEKLSITKSKDVTEIAVKNGEIKDLEDPKIYEVLGQWIGRSGNDPEWWDWYLTKYPQAERYLTREFKEKYELALRDLIHIDGYFKGVSNQHIQIISNSNYPFLHKERTKLIDDFSAILGQDKGEKWIEVLEYQPWGDFRKSPLIPLKSNNKNIYALIYWLFTASNAFFEAWISPLTLGDSQTAGKMRQTYGAGFERYVDEKLKTALISNLENHGGRKIKASDFPEIQPWLSRLPDTRTGGFQVDKILTKEDLAFVVSCKAIDFAFQREFIARDFFVPLSEFIDRISTNKEDLEEICIEAECIASNISIIETEDTFLRNTKYVVPILLTSRVEPLGINAVKEYFLDDEEIKRIPVLTISEFISLLGMPNADIIEITKSFRINEGPIAG